MKKINGYLRLMRPANILTAISDILAGVAIAGTFIVLTYGSPEQVLPTLGQLIIDQHSISSVFTILLLIVSTIGLYGGGVVLNDVFDARLDKKERPERPIPSGLISRKSAAVFGVVLLIIGVLAAGFSQKGFFFSPSLKIAIGIAIAAVLYDKWMKHSKFFGPLNMGVCRGLNLLLGMSVAPFALNFYWSVALIPVIYIAAITMISRGEVHGGKKRTLFIAAALYIIVMLTIVSYSSKHHTLTKSLPLIGLFALVVFPPLFSAVRQPSGPLIGKAVKAGVLGLILMNAAWAAAFGDMIFVAAILILFPLSYLFGRLFPVT